jgi:hypothetical protein
MPDDSPEGTLSSYTAFTIDEARPPTLTLVFSPEDVITLPYGHLYAAGWVKGRTGHQITLEHRACNLFIHGENLEPLLEGLEQFTVKIVHVFDPDRHSPVTDGATVVISIDDVDTDT